MQGETANLGGIKALFDNREFIDLLRHLERATGGRVQKLSGVARPTGTEAEASRAADLCFDGAWIECRPTRSPTPDGAEWYPPARAMRFQLMAEGRGTRHICPPVGGVKDAPSRWGLSSTPCRLP